MAGAISKKASYYINRCRLLQTRQASKLLHNFGEVTVSCSDGGLSGNPRVL